MSKYMKKPIVIEAFHYGVDVFYPEWLSEAINNKIIYFIDDEEGHHCLIRTLEGDMQVSDGDYIIQGIKGELYPCKPDIFEETYDIVADTTYSTTFTKWETSTTSNITYDRKIE